MVISLVVMRVLLLFCVCQSEHTLFGFPVEVGAADIWTFWGSNNEHQPSVRLGLTILEKQTLGSTWP